jgi:hypothetical protein
MNIPGPFCFLAVAMGSMPLSPVVFVVVLINLMLSSGTCSFSVWLRFIVPEIGVGLVNA